MTNYTETPSPYRQKKPLLESYPIEQAQGKAEGFLGMAGAMSGLLWPLASTGTLSGTVLFNKGKDNKSFIEKTFDPNTDPIANLSSAELTSAGLLAATTIFGYYLFKYSTTYLNSKNKALDKLNKNLNNFTANMYYLGWTVGAIIGRPIDNFFKKNKQDIENNSTKSQNSPTHKSNLGDFSLN